MAIASLFQGAGFLIIGLLMLCVLIFVHELGHFLLAKANGVGVLEFSIGFGTKIWRRRIGETFYSIGIIPLGGYVKMVGDDPRDLVTNEFQDVKVVTKEAAVEESKAEAAVDPRADLSPEDRAMLEDESRWFLNKGFLPKAAIVIAGPAFNIIFAVLASIASISIFGIVKPINLPIIGETVVGYPAHKAGLLHDDRVLSINGKELVTWEDLARTVTESSGATMTFVVERKINGQPEQKTIEVAGRIEGAEMAMLDSSDEKRPPGYRIGITPSIERTPVSLTKAISVGSRHVLWIGTVTVRGLWAMISNKVSANQIAGPVFIFQEAARSAERGVPDVLDFMIFLSVSLAIFNLLPIPVLDGGHLLFFFIELIKGTPVNLRMQQLATQVGMLLLFGLTLFALTNDFLR